MKRRSNIGLVTTKPTTTAASSPLVGPLEDSKGKIYWVLNGYITYYDFSTNPPIAANSSIYIDNADNPYWITPTGITFTNPNAPTITTTTNTTPVVTPTPMPVVTPILTPVTTQPTTLPESAQDTPYPSFTDASGNTYWVVNGEITYYNPNPTTIEDSTIIPTPVNAQPTILPDVNPTPMPVVTPILTPVTTQPTTLPESAQDTPYPSFTDASGNTYWVVNGEITYYNPNPTTIEDSTIIPTPVNAQPTILPDVNPTPTPVQSQAITPTPIATTTPTTTNPIDGYTFCVPENGSYDFGKNIVDVAFGANGQYMFMDNVTGIIDFNVATFGDPAFGLKKGGYYKIVTADTAAPVAIIPSGYTYCCDEGETYDFGTQLVNVAFGINGNFNFLYNVTGQISFDDATFDGDPAPKVKKQGFYQLVTQAQTTTTTPVTTTAVVPVTTTAVPTIDTKWLWIGGGALALWLLLRKK